MKRLGILMMGLFLLLSGCKSDFGQESRGGDAVNAATVQSQSDIVPQPTVSDDDFLSQ